MVNSKPASKPIAKKKKPKKGFKKFFREVISEVRKVSWPSVKELTNNTIAVVVFILVFAAIIGLIDLGLGQLFSLIS
jgi:preprotein translocase, SecE subunit, bacterial